MYSKMLLAILVFTFFCLPIQAQVDNLSIPNLSDESVIDLVAGIRPCRSELRLEIERIQRDQSSSVKNVIHNYGHGAVGTSIAEGCAEQVLKLVRSILERGDELSNVDKRIAVIGAGVAGLTTARLLQKCGYRVIVYAKDTVSTTSHISVGLWSPHFMQGGDKKLNEEIKAASFEILKKLADAHEEGVKWINYYDFSPRTSWGDDETFVSVRFENGLVKNACKSRRIIVDNSVYMKKLYEDTVKCGVLFEPYTLHNLEDVCDFEEKTIINCTGFGAQAICKDEEMTPVRGQLVHIARDEVLNKEINYGLLDHSITGNGKVWVSIFPWGDRLVIGGVLELRQEANIVDREVCKSILTNARKFFELERTDF